MRSVPEFRAIIEPCTFRTEVCKNVCVYGAATRSIFIFLDSVTTTTTTTTAAAAAAATAWLSEATNSAPRKSA